MDYYQYPYAKRLTGTTKIVRTRIIKSSIDGTDWGTKHKMCGFEDQAPIKIKSADATVLGTEKYFFPSTNKNVKGKLQHENGGNHLVLNFSEYKNNLGEIDFVLDTDQNKHNKNCTAIFFKFPAEHYFDDSRADMELQVNCSTMETGVLATRLVVIPVKIAAEGETQSHFFDVLEEQLPQNIDENQLPVDVNVDYFGDFMDPLSVFDGIYFYETYLNFPECDSMAYYFYINRSLIIKKELRDRLFKCLNSSKRAEDGNARDATPEPGVFLYKYQ